MSGGLRDTGDFGYTTNQRGALWRQRDAAPAEPFGAPAEIVR